MRWARKPEGGAPCARQRGRDKLYNFEGGSSHNLLRQVGRDEQVGGVCVCVRCRGPLGGFFRARRSVPP